VVSVVDAQPGDTIIDCCAAPGGKALNLASRLNGQGMNSQLSSVFINYESLLLLEEWRMRWSMQVYLQDERLMKLVGLCRQGCSSRCE
jgi:hypothetical protein